MQTLPVHRHKLHVVAGCSVSCACYICNWPWYSVCATSYIHTYARRQINSVHHCSVRTWHPKHCVHIYVRIVLFESLSKVAAGCSRLGPILINVLFFVCTPPPFPRGASLEHLVHYLIEDPAMLWTTMEGKKKPAGPNIGRVLSPHPPSVREITWFFLVTMRSFVDPLIFLRLLLHR